VVYRQLIQQIKFINKIAGLTRARFLVIFINEKGKTKTRLIMLPGSLTGGQSKKNIANRLMQEEILINTK